jgi:hypothetical protein
MFGELEGEHLPNVPHCGWDVFCDHSGDMDEDIEHDIAGYP